MRIADFMDLQYKAAESLTETNRIINELLNDSMIAEIRQSVTNFKDLTAQATINIQQTLTVSATRTEKVDTTGSTVINVKQTLTINATSTERVDTTGTVRITQTVTVTAHQTITVDVTALLRWKNIRSTARRMA